MKYNSHVYMREERLKMPALSMFFGIIPTPHCWSESVNCRRKDKVLCPSSESCSELGFMFPRKRYVKLNKRYINGECDIMEEKT